MGHLGEREWELSREELAEVLESILDERTEITYHELLSLLPEIEDNPELLAMLVDDLANLGVSIREEEESYETEIEKPTQTFADLDHISPDDLLSVYLAEMSQEPLLTHAEEIELARRIESGRQAEKTLQETDYTADEYARLEVAIQAGQAAREHL